MLALTSQVAVAAVGQGGSTYLTMVVGGILVAAVALAEGLAERQVVLAVFLQVVLEAL